MFPHSKEHIYSLDPTSLPFIERAQYAARSPMGEA